MHLWSMGWRGRGSRGANRPVVVEDTKGIINPLHEEPFRMHNHHCVSGNASRENSHHNSCRTLHQACGRKIFQSIFVSYPVRMEWPLFDVFFLCTRLLFFVKLHWKYHDAPFISKFNFCPTQKKLRVINKIYNSLFSFLVHAFVYAYIFKEVEVLLFLLKFQVRILFR